LYKAVIYCDLINERTNLRGTVEANAGDSQAVISGTLSNIECRDPKLRNSFTKSKAINFVKNLSIQSYHKIKVDLI
jgi:hypothetical protein